MSPERWLLAASLVLLALATWGRWLLRPNGWLTARLNAAFAEPLR